MNKYCIKNAYVFTRGVADLYLEKGQIIGAPDSDEGCTVIDGKGKTLFPGFCDIHTHPDKSMTAPLIPDAAGSLMEAIEETHRYMTNAPEEDFSRRILKMVKMCLSQGTTNLRSHITVDYKMGLKAWRAAQKVKEEVSSYMTMQNIIFSGECLSSSDPTYPYVIEAIESGADVLGACPRITADFRKSVDLVFSLAGEYGLPLDLHVDESDEPNLEVLEYVARRTMDLGMEGRVNVGHLTALNAVEPAEADRLIALCADAGLHVTTLPSCNVYLMGRNDRIRQRRGPTRINEFLDAGVNISLASDNIRDPFRPFGRGDLLEEALLTAQLTQKGLPEDWLKILEMITFSPARAMGLENYGLDAGCEASLVLVDAATPAEALVTQAMKTHVFSKGQLVHQRHLSEESLI